MSMPVDEAWLKVALDKHKRLAPLAAALLGNLLKEQGVEYLSITHRTKTLKGALEKISRKDYSNPAVQMTDLTGIRVVTYLERQVEQISDIIRQSFDIDDRNTLDKRVDLGSDKVGYRSFHFVCSLGESRSKLPEYGGISDLSFEIQVRTVLQHAWAELAHDNSFKTNLALPAEIQRKLNLHAAMLEIVDGAFQEIFDSVELYRKDIDKAGAEKIAESEINSISLSEFVERIGNQYGREVRENLGPEVVSETKKFGFETVGQFAAICTIEFLEKYFQIKTKYITTTGFVRSALMYSDIERYLSIPHAWRSMSRSTFAFLATKYGESRLTEILSSQGHDVHEEAALAESPKGNRTRRPLSPSAKTK